MKIIHSILIPALVPAVILVSCRKKEVEVAENQTQEAVQGSNDETARDEYDASVDDVFRALENTGISTGRMSSPASAVLPCGVVKIDSTGGSYNFNYDSTVNCSGRVLSGSITATLISGSQWSDAGAEIKLTYTGYTIQFNANNQIITIDGELIVTNIDGGKLWQVLAIGGKKTIKHSIHGDISVTFDGNTSAVRMWHISKLRTYKSTDGEISGIQWTLAADGSTAETGISKDGTPFVTTIPSPLLWENCSQVGSIEGPYVATNGELKYSAGGNSVTAEPGFIYDVSSKKIDQVNDCSSEGYKLTFRINGKTTVQFQYY